MLAKGLLFLVFIQFIWRDISEGTVSAGLNVLIKMYFGLHSIISEYVYFAIAGIRTKHCSDDEASFSTLV